jgi:hypothetical protein
VVRCEQMFSKQIFEAEPRGGEACVFFTGHDDLFL